MKNFVVVNFHPFVIPQDVEVYQNGELVQKLQVTVDRVPQVVKGLKSQYQIDSVSLVGGTDYLRKYAEELNSDFDYSDIRIVPKG